MLSHEIFCAGRIHDSLPHWLHFPLDLLPIQPHKAACMTTPALHTRPVGKVVHTLLLSVIPPADYGYIKVDGVSSVFCFIWGWEEPAWGLPFQFHGVFFVMISMKGP